MPRATPVYNTLIESLRARISSGEWAIGQRLPSIARLAQDFGVGVGSIREAVKALESTGLIRIEHGRGMFVASAGTAPADPHRHFEDVGSGSILALWEARRILEPELAAFAAERGLPEEHARIREQAVLMERLVAEKGDFLPPDLAFHRLIALAAHNPVLARMMDGVNDLLLESRQYTASHPQLQQHAVKYHLLIADAICDRSSVQARLLMLAHVNDAFGVLLSILKIQPTATDPAGVPAPPFQP